jgi:isopentenyl phosphate kinase
MADLGVAGCTVLLVKLGGSVITEKRRLRTPRRAAIKRLASELASIRQPVLVVHGAGSYGHILASRHRLNEGGSTSAKRAAAARVQADVRELDRIVVAAMNRAGFAAVPIPPSAILALDDGVVSTMDLTPFLEFSSMGFTPVTFGDVVRDLRRGFSVCSGDLLMLELARAFRPERAVFATDVDGLFTADPKRRPRAELLEKVGPKDLAKIEFSSASRTDVTGSIEGKLHRMFEIADHVDECLIVNGNVKNRVRDALRGKRVIGTRIVRGP